MTYEEKDFFISYHQADHEWAKWIAWHLEANGYSCVIGPWDFRPGSNFVLEEDNALVQTKRILMILSPDYLAHQSEWTAVFFRDPGALLPVRVRECNPLGRLATITPIDIVPPIEESVARDRLLARISGVRLKPSQSPIYPMSIPDFPGLNTISNTSHEASPRIGTKNDIPSGLVLRNTLQDSSKQINRIAWSPDGKLLASAYNNDFIKIWDINTGIVKYTFPGNINYSIAWSPDGKTLTSSHRSFLHLWSIETGKLRFTLDIPNQVSKSVVWSPNGKTLASGSNDNIIRLWDTITKQLLCEFTEHSSSINSLAWSPDGRVLASGSDDNTIRLWNPVTEQLIDTFIGHLDSVNTIAWSPNGHTIASASSDKTIRIWDFEERQLSTIIEGHTKPIVCIAFSHNGQLLASKSFDGTVRLWQCDTGRELAKLDEPVSSYGWYAGLAFHPNQTSLATLGERDTIIRIWDIDIDLNLDNASSVQYTSAKVVLVGDEGAGKTSLSLVLTDHPYVPPETTHGRTVQLFDSLKFNTNDLKEIREILLWDLAGQKHYRLIHQLSLNEVALALIIFNAYSSNDPLVDVEHWSHMLKMAQNMRNNANDLDDLQTPVKSFLVATHVDLKGKKVNHSRVDELKSYLQIDDYFETSAKEGIGVGELAEAIRNAINWTTLPTVNSISLFQGIKDFIAIRREKNWLNLPYIRDLYEGFLTSHPEIIDSEELFAQFETCLTHIESQGLIKRLNFSDHILLKPELLDYYASALIDAVLSYQKSDGLGSIPEETVLAGDFDIPSYDRLKDRGVEKILLAALVEYLLRHEIMLREYSDEGPYLIFPSLVTRELSGLTHIGKKAATFGFNGSVSNIYARLAVRLSHSFFFKKMEMWKDAISFTYPYDKKQATYGILLSSFAGGSGELTLYFSKNASNDGYSLFREYVLAFLNSHILLNFTKIYENNNNNANFSYDNYASIPLMDHAADSQRDHDIEITTHYGASQDKIERKKFDVFFCYNPRDKISVREIRRQLMARGLAPFFDEEDLRPGFPWQSQLEQHVKNIEAAAIFIGKEGVGVSWQFLEIQALLHEFVKRQCPIIPIILPNAPHNPEMPLFLQGMTHVDFRKPIFIPYSESKEDVLNNSQITFQPEDLDAYQDQEPIDLLVWGITGERANNFKYVKSEIKDEIKDEDTHKTEEASNYIINNDKNSNEVAVSKCDIFISCYHKDQEYAVEIVKLLKDNDIIVFLDIWDSRPSSPWHLALKQQIETVKSAAIFIGREGLDLWQQLELVSFLDEFTNRGCPVIPVLLPNTPSDMKIPHFFKNMTHIDFRKTYPDPLTHLIWNISRKYSERTYRSGVLITSLGNSPVAVSSMYDLLREKENLNIDRVTVLMPKNEEVEVAYKLVQETLSHVQGLELHCEQLEFNNVNSWINACIFLQKLYYILDYHQKQNDIVYLSLAGGRESIVALMSWVAPFFSCIKKLYYMIDEKEELFLSAYEIYVNSDMMRPRLMHPNLLQLLLVEIPFERGQHISKKLLSLLLSSQPTDYEKAEALMTGQAILQQGDIQQVYVTELAVEQFRELCKRNSVDAQEVRNGLLEMSKTTMLQAYEADVPEKFRGIFLHYFTGLRVPIRLVFYTLPEDIYTHPDVQVEQVVICSLEGPSTNNYKTLKEVTKLPNFSHKSYSPIDALPPVPSPTDSILIVPLGKSPMVVTQLYTLLREQEQHTIHEVVLIYPQLSVVINNSADMVRKVLREEYNVPCTRVGIPDLEDITSTEHCTIYQKRLEAEIERIKQQYPNYKIDLALSGGSKGMTAITTFAAQNKQIPYVYNTLITDEEISERIENETTITVLNSPRLRQQTRNDRLFLRAYQSDGPEPYAHFTLFRVPMFLVDGW